MADSRSTTSQKSVPQPTAPTYTAPKSEISLSLTYFKTGPGIVKLVQLALAIIIMACTAPAWGATHWFLFVVVTAFISTLIWSFIYLLNLRSAINLPIDWLLTELILTLVFAVLYIILSIVQLHSVVTRPRPPDRLKPFYVIAGIFGIFNTVAYLAGTFFLYRDWKDSHPHSDFTGNVKSNP